MTSSTWTDVMFSMLEDGDGQREQAYTSVLAQRSDEHEEAVERRKATCCGEASGDRSARSPDALLCIGAWHGISPAA